MFSVKKVAQVAFYMKKLLYKTKRKMFATKKHEKTLNKHEKRQKFDCFQKNLET